MGPNKVPLSFYIGMQAPGTGIGLKKTCTNLGDTQEPFTGM